MGGDDGVVFQAEGKYVQRFLDLRSQQPRVWSKGNGVGEKRHLWIPLWAALPRNTWVSNGSALPSPLGDQLQLHT